MKNQFYLNFDEQVYETEDEQVLTDIIKVVNGVTVTY